ncbi:MAG: transporter, partial [Woeseiaceae bacterium]
MKHLSLRVALLLIASHPAYAQQDDLISTERPSFSNTPYTMAAGRWQIESGYEYVNDDDGADLEQHTLPQLLLRYGLSEDMELQLAWPGFSRREAGGQSDDGIRDAAVAVKFGLRDETAGTPVAFLAGMTVPVGDDGFTSDDFEPFIGVSWVRAMFFGTAAISKDDSDYDFDNGVGVRFALRGDASVFAEWHATIPDDGDAVHRLNGGVLWLRRPNMQLDLHVGVGLNDRAADYALGAGFS